MLEKFPSDIKSFEEEKLIQIPPVIEALKSSRIISNKGIT
jgi:hypothetical protein